MLETSHGARTQLVVFTLDGLRYAVPLECVERVVRIVEIRPLPQLPPIVEGAINLEGEIVAVMNPRAPFGLPERAVALSDELLIGRTRNRRVALHVEAVAGVHDCANEDIVSAQAVAQGTRYVVGVAKLPDGMVLIHDLDRFLSAEEEKRLEDALRDA